MPGWGHADSQAKPGRVFPIVLCPGMQDFLPLSKGQGNAAATNTWSGTAYFMPFVVHRTVTIKRLACLNGATIEGKVEMAIYNESYSQIVTSGAVNQSGANTQQVFDITDTDLVPGLYYLGFASESASATATFYGSLANTLRNVSFTSLASADYEKFHNVYTQTIGAGLMPATFTPAYITTQGRLPFVSIYRSAA